jgi:hypothetical protein
MDTSNLISSLVDTYKELNMKYRNMPENADVKSIVTRMRDDEIQFSKALKDRLTGIGTATDDMNEGSDVVQGSDDNVAHIISLFGSARATTLNLLKGINDDAAWQGNVSDEMTLLQRVEQLAQSDTNQLRKLSEVTGV